MSKKDITDDINVIITDFHSSLSKILKICKRIEPNNVDLKWLHGIVALSRDIDPLTIIDRCASKLWLYREQIINEDESFFMTHNFATFIKDDENKSFMYNLLNLIKSKFTEMSMPEKKMIWTLIKGMLAAVARYKKALSYAS